MIIDNKSYTGDGSTRQFATSSIILSNSHIAVFLDNVLQSTSSYDILGSVVLFQTAPSINVAINFIVSDTGEDLPVVPSEYSTVYNNIAEIQNVSSISNEIVEVDSLLTEIVGVYNALTQITSVYTDKSTIDGLYSSKTAIDSLYSIKAKLDSLYADKLTLDGLYSSKTAIDALFTSKTAIDSLYSIKAKLDSLYTDKATLDSIFTDKATLDSLYADKSKLDSLYADKTELDTLYTNLTQLLFVYDNLTAISSIYNNMPDVNYFADIYLGSKASSPTLRNDGSALQVGDLYYNSTFKTMYAYDGTVWNTAYASIDSYSKSETENTLPNIGFDVNAGVSVGVGQVAWNLDEGTLDVGQENSTLQLGQETQWNCRNNTGVTIPNGTPVMATGTIGASGRITIAPFDGTVKSNARFYLGLTTHDIADGADGKVTHFGKVRGIDTTGTPYGEVWSDGDLIYPSTTVVGALTNIEPSGAGDIKIESIQVVYAHANGTLAVRVNGTDQHMLAEEVSYDGTSQTVKAELDNKANQATTYTKTETDNYKQVKFTSKSQVKGKFSLSNTVLTAGAGTKLYTGNGTTQSINAGIDLATQWGDNTNETYGGLVWVKNRDTTNSHSLLDTIRGAGNFISTNSTSIGGDESAYFTAFTNIGFDCALGGSTYNATSNNYASWIFQTTHRITGTTNHGQAYECHYNPTTGFTMIKYTGSGIAGHEIPHHLCRELGLLIEKCTSLSSTNWNTLYGTKLGLLNLTNAFVDTVVQAPQYSDNVSIVVGNGGYNSSNATDASYILYGWANSYYDDAGVLNGNYEVGTYQPDNTVGFKIKTKNKPCWFMYKRLDVTGNWGTFDNQRNEYSGSFDGILLANSSGAETTGVDYVEFVEDGIILNNTSTDYNTSGGQYLYFIMYDNDSGSGLSKYPKASETSNITVTDGLAMYSNGYDSNGEIGSIENIGNTTLTGITWDI